MPTGTGRLNRASGFLTQPFLERLLLHEIARAKRYSDPIVLLRLSLHFNGPPDEAAIAQARSIVSHILNANLRAVDIPGHYEDDYLIILPNTSEAGGRLIASRLAQVVTARRAMNDAGAVPLAICMGLTAHPGGQDADAEALVSQTAIALAEARRRGANSVVEFAEVGTS